MYFTYILKVTLLSPIYYSHCKCLSFFINEYMMICLEPDACRIIIQVKQAGIEVDRQSIDHVRKQSSKQRGRRRKKLTLGRFHSYFLGQGLLKQMVSSTQGNSGSSNRCPNCLHVSRICFDFWACIPWKGSLRAALFPLGGMLATGAGYSLGQSGIQIHKLGGNPLWNINVGQMLLIVVHYIDNNSLLLLLHGIPFNIPRYNP